MHGWLELVLAPTMILLPLALGFGDVARGFFITMGIAAFLVWLTTDYALAERDPHQRYWREDHAGRGPAPTA
jgi:hypothetical protein